MYANHAEVLANNHSQPPQRNVRELDTLLDDLNRSRYSTGHENSDDARPSVDSLLNELSNAVHKYQINHSIAFSFRGRSIVVVVVTIPLFYN